jgi:serine/threonine protein kinase
MMATLNARVTMPAVVLESKKRRVELRWMLFSSPFLFYFAMVGLLSSASSFWSTIFASSQLTAMPMLGTVPWILLQVAMKLAYDDRLKIENGKISTGRMFAHSFPLCDLIEVSGDHGNEENDFRETIVLKFENNRKIEIPLEDYDEESIRAVLTHLKRVAPQCSYSYSDVISLESRGLLRFLISAAPADSQILKLNKSPMQDAVVHVIQQKERVFWLLFMCISFLAATVLSGYEIFMHLQLANHVNANVLWDPAADTTRFAMQLAEQSPNWWTLLCVRAAMTIQVTLNYLVAGGSNMLPSIWCGLVLIGSGLVSLRAALPLFAFVDSKSIGMGTNFLPWVSVKTVTLRKENRMSESLDGRLTVEGENRYQTLSIDLTRIPDLKKRLLLLRLVDRYAENAQRSDDFLRAVHTSTDIQFTDLWLDGQSTEPQPDFQAQSTVGTKLKNGEYEVDSILGFGGQATTYLARRTNRSPDHKGIVNGSDRDSDAQVVVKEIVLPSQADVRVMQDAVSRFERGANLLAGLTHPQVVKLLDHFVENDKAYLVLQYIQGRTMRQVLKDAGPPDADMVRNWGLQLCDILDYLHSRDPAVIHCDLAPDNLIVTPSGQIKLVDFDVARVLDAKAYSVIAGRPAYTPPEQFRGNPTIQSDIFALGAILHFLLNGEDPPPLGGEIDAADLPNSMTRIELLIKDCLAFEASGRPVSAAVIRERLENLDQSERLDNGVVDDKGDRVAHDSVVKDKRNRVVDGGVDRHVDRAAETAASAEGEESAKIDLTIKIPEEKVKVYRETDLTVT